MEPKIIVALDSFKGCLTSTEANQAAAEGIIGKSAGAEVLQIPVSDGGEGWLEAFRTATGGMTIELTVYDALMRPVKAHYLINDETAVIEMAQASGLTLLSPEERNPMRTTSYGTGQLVADAIRRGCRHIIVGLGGSATSDCGIGMLHALIDNLAKHGTWNDLQALFTRQHSQRSSDGIRFTIATDVVNPLCGPHGAAHVFAPQKMAPGQPEETTTAMVLSLDARAGRFADVSARHFGYDRRNEPGAGAAGGLGYAFLQYMNATCRPGIDLLLDALGFDHLLSGASLVITGEGAADRQTLMGKLPFGILQRAQCQHVPVCLLAGRIADRQALLDAGFSVVRCINPADLPTDEAMKPSVAKHNISAAVTSVLSSVLTL